MDNSLLVMILLFSVGYIIYKELGLWCFKCLKRMKLQYREDGNGRRYLNNEVIIWFSSGRKVIKKNYKCMGCNNEITIEQDLSSSN